MFLRYIDGYMQSGLEELYLQYGTSKGPWMIPFDVWYTELGVEWSRILIKVKVLSGNDFLSCNQVESTSMLLTLFRMGGGGQKDHSLPVFPL